VADPFHDVRAACLAATAWLVRGRRDRVLVLSAATPVHGLPLSPGAPGDPSTPPPTSDAARASRAAMLAEHLLGACGHLGGLDRLVLPGGGPVPDLSGRAVLVLADGSARRSETAPGYLDTRALPFDADVGAALRTGDLARLRDLDLGLGADLLAEGAPVQQALAGSLDRVESAEVAYDDDPFGVQYWVVRWVCRAGTVGPDAG
jgi:hypothetical protein